MLQSFLSAVMAELADATGLGPVSSDGVQVQVLLTAREFIASRLVLSGGFFIAQKPRYFTVLFRYLHFHLEFVY